MTKHVNFRLPDDLHELAVAAAAADDRSLNSWLVAAVRRAVQSQGTPDYLSGEPATSAPLRGKPDSPPA